MAFHDYRSRPQGTVLDRAVLDNKPDDVRRALNCGFSANLPDNRGWTPVHIAAVDDAKNECLMELLTDSDTDINAQTSLDETPLYLACQRNCVMNVKLLLQIPGCEVNLCASLDMSPLHVACNEGNIQVVKYLIECGAEVNIVNDNFYTPLHIAVDSDYNLDYKRRDEISYEICQYLLQHGANPDKRDCQGNFPFHLACQSGLFKCAKLLLSVSKQKNNLINLEQPHGKMPFAMEEAIMWRNTETVLLLLQHSNVFEPEDVIHWIIDKNSGNQEKLIEVLLPLAPYYKPSDQLLPDNPMRKVLLAPKVYPLTHYCRTIIRKQLHKESESCPTLFRHKLSHLMIPKDLYSFLSFM